MKESGKEVEKEIFILLVRIIINAMNVVSDTGETGKETIFIGSHF